MDVCLELPLPSRTAQVSAVKRCFHIYGLSFKFY